MKDYFTGLTAGVLLTFVTMWFWPGGIHPTKTVPSNAPVAVTEDSPGWDCSTMGNRSCSPDPANDRWAYVEEDGSIAGWGCLQGYLCDDTLHVYIPLDEVAP